MRCNLAHSPRRPATGIVFPQHVPSRRHAGCGRLAGLEAGADRCVMRGHRPVALPRTEERSMDQSTMTPPEALHDALASAALDKTLRVLGLTKDGRLVRFRAQTPKNTKTLGMIQGFRSPDTMLIGMDFRVQDGKLYGVGNGGGGDTIDPQTAQLTFVNALTVPLMGTLFGLDFSPAADRLRIISDTGQNLAHDVNPGGITIAQGTLTYTAPPAAPVPALGVTGAAY